MRFVVAVLLIAWIAFSIHCLTPPAHSAPLPDTVCGDANTPEEERADVFAVAEDAVVHVLSGTEAPGFMAYLISLGMPEPPVHDAVWVVEWPNGTGTILLFKDGCRNAIANGIPYEVLKPGLGTDA